MATFEIWAYRGVVSLLLIVVWYFVRSGFSGIRKDIQLLISEIKSLSFKTIEHEAEIVSMGTSVSSLTRRADIADDRIRSLELVQAACSNKKGA